MLPRGIHEEARAGLDREREVEIAREGSHAAHLGPVEPVEVDLADVRRDRDPAVAEAREQRERILEPMVSEPVRVVGEAEHARSLALARVGPLCAQPGSAGDFEVRGAGITGGSSDVGAGRFDVLSKP